MTGAAQESSTMDESSCVGREELQSLEGEASCEGPSSVPLSV